MANDNQQGYGYGKRPLWQWILLYIVIGGVLYALAYYFFFANKGGYTYNPTNSTYGTPGQLPMAQPAPAQPAQTTQTQTTVQTTAQPPVTPPPTQTSTAPSRVSASIANFTFSPATITIKKGGTVTWTNSDSAPHTVTSDTGAFASQTLSQGGSYSHTFSTTGTFTYHCSIHPTMHGTVVVAE